MPVRSVPSQALSLQTEMPSYLSVSPPGCKLLEDTDYVLLSVFMTSRCLAQRRHFIRVAIVAALTGCSSRGWVLTPQCPAAQISIPGCVCPTELQAF